MQAMKRYVGPEARATWEATRPFVITGRRS